MGIVKGLWWVVDETNKIKLTRQTREAGGREEEGNLDFFSLLR